MNGRWHVLGFTADDIILAYQHARMAEECMKAWRHAGSPGGCRIVEAAGNGEHLVYWFVNREAAAILDSEGVKWRQRIVDDRSELPPGNHDLLGGKP
jgi:hypothetical protein